MELGGLIIGGERRAKEKGAGTFGRTADDLQIMPPACRDLFRKRDFLRLWAGMATLLHEILEDGFRGRA